MPADNSRRVWAFGKPRIVKTMPDVRTAAVGFYPINGTSVLRSSERVHKEAICEVFEAIREQNPVRRILLVLDNFGSHISPVTKQRAKELGIRLVFLPVASPHLQPIEPVWNSLKLTIRLSFANDWIETFLDIRKLR